MTPSPSVKLWVGIEGDNPVATHIQKFCPQMEFINLWSLQSPPAAPALGLASSCKANLGPRLQTVTVE